MSLSRLIAQYLGDEFPLSPQEIAASSPSRPMESPPPPVARPEAPKSIPKEAPMPIENTPQPPVEVKIIPPAPKNVSIEGKLGVPEDPELKELYMDCLKNLHYGLVETATNLVFGSGSRHASIMIIGEAPGADEDEQGLPFVGRSGSYMMDVFSKHGITREQVYIANIVKHRPPNNRPPQPAEIEACVPYLVKQIDLIKPKLLVTAGNFACKFILQTDTGITKMRGQIHKSSYGKVFPVLHPSAIIRGAYPKDLFEADIEKIAELVRSL
ncbi:MAG: uracil-DNA glycosylase family protein [Brevinema sp.]